MRGPVFQAESRTPPPCQSPWGPVTSGVHQLYTGRAGQVRWARAHVPTSGVALLWKGPWGEPPLLEKQVRVGDRRVRSSHFLPAPRDPAGPIWSSVNASTLAWKRLRGQCPASSGVRGPCHLAAQVAWTEHGVALSGDGHLWPGAEPVVAGLQPRTWRAPAESGWGSYPLQQAVLLPLLTAQEGAPELCQQNAGVVGHCALL